ncbi:10222_t:CDS:2 [Racocetra fulgida]|uniref:10222_t:CDS:1 n=1 Tax=Racocetra fulgida TaxID=60492 RepID=A0A9N9FAR8_9GLOM|nr:10222_t:CDS:2 [Racocetra fulgida]
MLVILGSIKHHNSNDGYNIRLGSIKESLDSELLLFLTEFEIGNMLEKDRFLDEENKEVETGLIHDNISELAVEKLLYSHQQRLTARQNLLDKYDFATSNSEIYNSNNDNMFDGRYVILLAIQLQLYKKSIEEITQIESGVIEAEDLMKKNLE